MGDTVHALRHEVSNHSLLRQLCVFLIFGHCGGGVHLLRADRIHALMHAQLRLAVMTGSHSLQHIIQLLALIQAHVEVVLLASTGKANVSTGTVCAAINQRMCGVHGGTLCTVHGQSVAQLDILAHVFGGKSDGAAMLHMAHLQRTILAHALDVPAVAILHEITACKDRQTAVIAAGHDYIARKGGGLTCTGCRARAQDNALAGRLTRSGNTVRLSQSIQGRDGLIR